MSFPANPGLPPERPEHEVMLHQLARHWRDWTRWPGGLKFADPLAPLGTPAVANLYAGTPMPAMGLVNARHREEVACSLTLGPEPGPEIGSPRTRVIVIAEAHAPVRKTALRLLQDLRALLFAGERPWCHAPLYHGVEVADMGGLIGIPPYEYFAGDTDKLLWRLRGVEIVAEPQPLLIEAGPSASPDGQGTAQFAFAPWGVPDSLPAPVPHFVVAHSGAGGVTAATATVLRSPYSTLALSRTVGAAAPVVNTIDLATVGTVAQLITAINALANGWSAAEPASIDPRAELARPAIDLEPRSETSALGAGATLRAWA